MGHEILGPRVGNSYLIWAYKVQLGIAVGRSENSWGMNSPLIRIGLTDLPKSGGRGDRRTCSNGTAR